MALGIDAVHGIETRGRRTGDVEITVVVKSQVKGRDAWFDHREHEDLPVASDLEDGPTAIADVQIAFAIERDTGGHSHAFGVRSYVAAFGRTIDGAVITRRDIQAAVMPEGHASWIHHLGYEGLHIMTGVDAEDRHGHFLSPRSGKRSVDIALGINRWIGDRMQILRDWHGNPHLARIAAVAVGCDNHVPR